MSIQTEKLIKSDVKLFTAWLLKTQNEQRQFEDNECQYLARLFLSLRNKNGEEYEPKTRLSIQSSINRHLTCKTESRMNILTDKDFQHLRDVLSAKRKQLKTKCFRNRKKEGRSFYNR